MTSNLPPISIGIPFYNAEETLLDAVRSIFAQTHQDWELILLDDGSTDRSLELARSIKDPRVQVHSDGENRRLAARLNQMSGLASYDFLARMDADDLISPNRLERQIKILLSKPEVDLVSTGVCSLTDENVPLGVRCVASDYTITGASLLAGRAGIVHASLVGRTAWFRRNKYREDLTSSEDANLWIRAFSKDDLNVFFITEPLYYYREDGNVTSAKLRTAYREGLRTILQDAGSGFSTGEKIHGFTLVLAKLLVTHILSASGSLSYLRSRRNGPALSKTQKNCMQQEIDAILDVSLPS